MAQTADVAPSDGDENDGLNIDGNINDTSNTVANSERIRVEQNNADIEVDNLINREIGEIIICKKGNKDEISCCAELELAVANCKKCLRKISDNERSIERMQLMEKLVRYQLELDALKEELSDPVQKNRALNTITVMGHKFSLQSSAGRNPYCEVCLSTIWRLIQSYRRCNYQEQKFVRNLHLINRPTNVQNVTTLYNLVSEITCWFGLYSFEVLFTEIKDGAADSEPRLCDYNGHYYCPRCHWNDEWFIPARIIHNWDFSKYKVCRASKQLLVIIERRPLFNILKLNSRLVNYIDQLAKINKLRRNILLMKCYFMCCKVARKQRILQNLRHRQHFVENSDMYSLTDLVDLYQGRLLPDVESIIQIYTEHITKDCLICKGKGFICELCNDTTVIFPFSENVATCRNCIAAFHQECFNIKSKHCPRCLRRKSFAHSVLPVDDIT